MSKTLAQVTDPDPNEAMKRRDREGAPWIPLNNTLPPTAVVRSKSEVQTEKLARAISKTWRQIDNVPLGIGML